MSWLRVLGAFLLCVGLGVAGALALRARMRQGGIALVRGERRVRVLEQVRASAHGDVCLVQWDGIELLVAMTPGGASVLAQNPRAAEAADPS